MKNSIVNTGLGITFADVEDRVLIVRNQQILLDRDVAELYGVGTREINQAVKTTPTSFRTDTSFH